ncbi:hypothetical protein AB3S75_024908 [Citrus x aurantiifolia]
MSMFSIKADVTRGAPFTGAHSTRAYQMLMSKQRLRFISVNQQSVGSTSNGVPLSGLTGFAPQFESQGSRLCWENLCLPVRAGTSSLSCGTGLKVSPTVGALPKIPRD